MYSFGTSHVRNHRKRSKSATFTSKKKKRVRSKSAIVASTGQASKPLFTRSTSVKFHTVRRVDEYGWNHQNLVDPQYPCRALSGKRVNYDTGQTIEKRPFRYRSLSSFSIPTVSARALTSTEWRRKSQPHVHTRLIYPDHRKTMSLRKTFKSSSIKCSIPYYIHPRYAVNTRYDALPFLDRVPEYKVTGPLITIFDYFSALDNPHTELRWAALTFEEMQYGSNTMSTHELLYFCHHFRMLGKRLLKRNEVQIICQNTSGFSEKLRRAGLKLTENEKPHHTSCKTLYAQSCQLDLEEFCIVLARFAIILYPRLNVGGLWSDIDYKENATDIEKWKAFVTVFGLNDSKYIQERIKNSRFVSNARLRSTSFVYNIRQNAKCIVTPINGGGGGIRETGSDLMRMGLSAKIGRKLGRTINCKQLPFGPMSQELLDKVKDLLYKEPRRDWRKYQGPFINFGLIVRRQLRYDAVIEITNADKERETKWLTASLDEDAPSFVSLKGRMKILLFYGIRWKLLVHLNMKETMDIDLDIAFVFNVLVHEGAREQEKKLVAKIPIYLKLVEEIKKTQRPCLKLIDVNERIQFVVQNTL